MRRIAPTLLRVGVALVLAASAPPVLAEYAAEPPAYQLDGQYRFDLWTGLSGPLKGRTGTAGLLDLRAGIDAERAWGWTGTRLFAHVLGSHGNQPNRSHGGAQGLDNIEAKVDTLTLFEAWVERALFDDRASVLFGLLDLNAEFQVTESTAVLIHPGFGTASELGQTGRNGPSVFPVSSLALRGRWRFDDDLSVRAAVFDGVPGDPAHPDGTHVKLGHGDGTLAIEVDGDGFLRHMVRGIAGTLMDVGHGRRPAHSIEPMLASRDRAQAGRTAPAHGLFLVKVRF